jgi:hypothetical protein
LSLNNKITEHVNSNIFWLLNFRNHNTAGCNYRREQLIAFCAIKQKEKDKIKSLQNNANAKHIKQKLTWIMLMRNTSQLQAYEMRLLKSTI